MSEAAIVKEALGRLVHGGLRKTEHLVVANPGRIQAAGAMTASSRPFFALAGSPSKMASGVCTV
jgi:hypothetical protein